MKNKSIFKYLLIALLCICLACAFAACGEKKDDTGGNGGDNSINGTQTATPPTATQLSAVGVSGEFNTSGIAATYSKTNVDTGDEAAVGLFWTGATSTDLDAAITEINNKGFATSSAKETVDGITSYEATKTVDGVEYAAIAVYFSTTKTIEGYTFNANDMYVIFEK